MDDLKGFIDYFFENSLMPRDAQMVAVAHLEANWNQYKYFIVDAPVGVGKSHLALAMGSKSKNVYILTSTKMLQEQYQKTNTRVVNIMGRSNYQCTVDPMFTAEAAPCIGNFELAAKCRNAGTCPYYRQRDLAINAQLTVSSYAYLLAASQTAETVEGEPLWTQRSVMLMDEAHELPAHLVNQAETTINLGELYAKFGIGGDDWMFTDNIQENHVIVTKIFNQLDERIADYNSKITNLFEKQGAIGSVGQKIVDKVNGLNSQMKELQGMRSKLGYYMKTVGTGNWLQTPDIETNSVTLSPLYASELFNLTMADLAEKFVFMSATIGPPDVFARELGIPLEEICVISVDTPFPPELSPVIYQPVARLNHKEIDASIPKVQEAINRILDAHKGEKGIIHTGNYRLMTDIVNGASPENKKRMLYRDMNGNTPYTQTNNQRLLEMHEHDSRDTVLVSPSMTTGVDLQGELSRFQIIVKLPFLSLGDPRVKKKSDLDSRWYRTQMWLTLLQSSGRSTRNEEDYALTYILDASFERFWNMDVASMPKWFIDRVQSGLALRQS